MLVGCASAQPETGAMTTPLTVAYRNTVLLPASTTDQNGVAFTIAGLSGIAWVGAYTGGPDAGGFVAVMDNSNKLVKLALTFAPDGAITGAVVAGGVSLAASRDFEGIAAGARDPQGVVRTVLISEEDSPAVLEFRLADGALVRTITPPAVFAGKRANYGFESCALGAGWLWNANEEALSLDGPLSTPSAGTVVRLLRTSLSFPPTASRQYAYRTQPMHGSTISGARSGVSDLVALPDGRLMVLERSFAFSLAGLFQTRIYEASFAGATEVSGFTSGLSGQTFTVVGKRLLYQGNLNNLEGLALGPELPNASRALVGIVDNGDPVSKSAVVGFEVGGVRAAGVAQAGPTAVRLPRP
jgi:hypothetical protein